MNVHSRTEVNERLIETLEAKRQVPIFSFAQN